jgi:hypothetical protein
MGFCLVREAGAARSATLWLSSRSCDLNIAGRFPIDNKPVMLPVMLSSLTTTLWRATHVIRHWLETHVADVAAVAAAAACFCLRFYCRCRLLRDLSWDEA